MYSPEEGVCTRQPPTPGPLLSPVSRAFQPRGGSGKVRAPVPRIRPFVYSPEEGARTNTHRGGVRAPVPRIGTFVYSPEEGVWPLRPPTPGTPVSPVSRAFQPRCGSVEVVRREFGAKRDAGRRRGRNFFEGGPKRQKCCTSKSVFGHTRSGERFCDTQGEYPQEYLLVVYSPLVPLWYVQGCLLVVYSRRKGEYTTKSTPWN